MSHPLVAKRPGQSIVMFAVMISAIMAILALGTDLLVMYVERREAQGAADLAALSGAPLSMSGSPSPAETQARTTATANGYTNGTGGVVVQITYPVASQMRVRITKAVPTYFARIIGWSTTTVLGQATAAQNPPPPNMAIYGRNASTNSAYTVDLTGGGGAVTINGTIYSYCDLRVGSNYTVLAAIWYNGDDSGCSITQNSTTAPTPYKVGPKPYPIGPPITQYSPDYPCDYDKQGPVPNVVSLGRKPYANELYLLPGSGTHAHTGQFDLANSVGDNGTWWLTAPTGPNPSLKPGVYCVQDGNLKWSAGSISNVTGNVTFVLAGTGSSVGPFSPNNFTITPFKNQMLFMLPDSIANNTVTINGSGGSWGGYIYAPGLNASVNLAGSGTRSLTGAIFADSVNITGGAWTLIGTGPVPTGIYVSGLTE